MQATDSKKTITPLRDLRYQHLIYLHYEHLSTLNLIYSVACSPLQLDNPFSCPHHDPLL